jgi:uncharacterized membrane protein
MLRELTQAVMGNHDLIVHFPIVLLTTSFIFGVMGIFYKRGLFKEIVFYNLLFGMITLAGAIYSGIEEESLIEDPLLIEKAELHKRNAWIMSLFFFLLFTWMGWRKRKMKSQEYLAWLAVFFIASASVIYQGNLGYEMREMKMRSKKIPLVPKENKEMDYGWNF